MTTIELRLTLDDIYFAIGSGPARASVFAGFNAEFGVTGQTLTFLRGSNGIGKSVLAKLLAGHLTPDSGKISVLDALGNCTAAMVVYIPQNFEALHDRYAIDLFASIASARRPFVDPFALRNALSQVNIRGRRDLFATCDTVARFTLLLGAIVAADLAQPDLIILDEPFAHVSPVERQSMDSYLNKRHGDRRAPILVIAHPDETPLPGGAAELLLESRADGSKLLRQVTRPVARGPHRSPVAGSSRLSVDIQWRNEPQRKLEVLDETMNRIVSPPSLSPGRFAALIVNALKTKRTAFSGSWSVAITYHRPDASRAIRVGFLPALAQTTVVLTSAPLADSSLFGRWEEAPSRRLSGRIDRLTLEKRWFREAASFLPIQLEEPEIPGIALSGGNRQLLALRTTSYPLPDILVLVTPYAGLDEANATRAERFLEFAAASGVVVIIVEAAT